MYSVLNKLREYINFYKSKNINSYNLLLVLKIVKYLQYILKYTNNFCPILNLQL